MPSRTRTLTKRVKYLRRQQEISKNAKRKARRVRTHKHKHNKSVKRNKKVMRGGGSTSILRMYCMTKYQAQKQFEIIIRLVI